MRNLDGPSGGRHADVPGTGTVTLSMVVRRDGEGRATVAATGEVDLANAGEIPRTVRALVAQGVRCVELDAAGITFIDMAGLAALHALADEAPSWRGGSFRLVAASPTVRRLLDLTEQVMSWSATDPAGAGPTGRGRAGRPCTPAPSRRWRSAARRRRRARRRRA